MTARRRVSNNFRLRARRARLQKAEPDAGRSRARRRKFCPAGTVTCARSTVQNIFARARVERGRRKLNSSRVLTRARRRKFCPAGTVTCVRSTVQKKIARARVARARRKPNRSRALTPAHARAQKKILPRRDGDVCTLNRQKKIARSLGTLRCAIHSRIAFLAQKRVVRWA